jgi:hypothetical protein
MHGFLVFQNFWLTIGFMGTVLILTAGLLLLEELNFISFFNILFFDDIGRFIGAQLIPAHNFIDSNTYIDEEVGATPLQLFVTMLIPNSLS